MENVIIAAGLSATVKPPDYVVLGTTTGAPGAEDWMTMLRFQIFESTWLIARSKFLTRSMELLHVAAARVRMCSVFASADDRQFAVAKATGLKVVDIRRRVRRKKSL